MFGEAKLPVLNFLSKTWVLITLFIAMLAIGYSFSLVMPAVGGVLLDTLFTSEEVLARLGEMSAGQKRVHLLATIVIDTAYPLAYGGLMLGLTWRFAGLLRNWFIIAPLAVMFVDFAENLVQALALVDNTALLSLKDFLTPAKFGLFAVAVVLVLVSFLIAALRKLRGTG
ncbi:MAG: hypothetical protein AAF098_00925 [Pseudomonadota bacterium]